MGMIENVVTGIWKLLGNSQGRDAIMWHQQEELKEDPRSWYQLRRLLYENTTAFREMESTDMVLGLRNLSHAAVDFFALTTWPGSLPGALPITTNLNGEAEQRLLAGIHQVWAWSDWSIAKQDYVRGKAMDGDGLIQIATRTNAAGEVDQVYFKVLDVENLTDFDLDERGFLTWLRMDIPRTRRMPSGRLEGYVHTEVWDKATATQRVWEHEQGLDAPLDRLPAPDTTRSIESMTGTDMLPFVHGRHMRRIGRKRGVSAIDHALVKIHEANRAASALHSMGFQYGDPDMQLVADVVSDSSGRPLQMPSLDEKNAKLKIGRKQLWKLPAGWSLQGISLDVPFDDLLAIINDDLLHIQESDLPQMAYYKLASSSRDLSGEALGHMLKPAVELALEARGLSETELVRANQIALTVAAHHNLSANGVPYRSLGSYDVGNFDHGFEEREIIPLTATEKAEVEKTRSEAAINRQGYGWSDRALLEADGLTAEKIATMQAEREVTEMERGERLLRLGDAGVDREV